MSVSPWLWAVFIGIVLVLLIIDLGLFNKDDAEISIKKSLQMSAFYIAIAGLFGGWMWWQFGAESGMSYFTGYVLEKTLSLDNIFVIALIFSTLQVPLKYQHRVLFYGILGVIVLRAIFIGLGAAIVSEFAWVMYIFGAFLVFTGIKMLLADDGHTDIKENRIYQYLTKHFRFTDTIENHDFFVKKQVDQKVVTYGTPLLLALIMVEIVDLVFAVDSIPAIFSITQEPFIVYTSNIFAILGLRSLYFALGAMLERFEYLKYALAGLLIFIGTKLFIIKWIHIPIAITLSITIGAIAAGVVFSLWKTKNLSNHNTH